MFLALRAMLHDPETKVLALTALLAILVGAIVYMVLEHRLAQAYPTTWQLGIGIVLMAVALYARNGLLGLGEALKRRLSRRPAGGESR